MPCALLSLNARAKPRCAACATMPTLSTQKSPSPWITGLKKTSVPATYHQMSAACVWKRLNALARRPAKPVKLHCLLRKKSYCICVRTVNSIPPSSLRAWPMLAVHCGQAASGSNERFLATLAALGGQAIYDYAEADASMDYLYGFSDKDLKDRLETERQFIPEAL